MKKYVSKLIVVLMITAILSGNLLPFAVGANTPGSEDQGISTYLTNCNKCSCTFAAGYEGQALVGVTYNAKSDVFTYAKLTVKIQKRFLGIFWTTVDIGETNNEWVAYCYDVDGEFYNAFPLESTGTYRAVFTVEFYGTSGVVDVIEDTIQSVYN